MKIVFCGGGTAGHVMPNIALAQQLQEDQLHYVGTDGMEKQLVTDSRLFRSYRTISAPKFQRKFCVQNVLLPAKLIKSVREAKAHLKDIRPDVVFGKGGYAALPVAIAARLLKIPLVVHESDLTLGLANRICSLFCTRTLSTFPLKRATQVGAIVRKSVVCGNRQKGLQIMGLDGKKPILLVMGGSLGAQALNNAVCKSAPLMNKFDLFVITGKGKTLNCDVHSAPFVEDVGSVYAASSMCLTRAGSNALSELALVRLPFLAVPLTRGSRGEQVKNARWFAERGMGLVADEKQLENLPRLVQKLYEQRTAIANAQRKFDFYGTEKAAEEILKAAKK